MAEEAWEETSRNPTHIKKMFMFYGADLKGDWCNK